MVTAPAALVAAPLAGLLAAATITHDMAVAVATIVLGLVVTGGIKWLRRSVLRDLDDHIDERVRRHLERDKPAT